MSDSSAQESSPGARLERAIRALDRGDLSAARQHWSALRDVDRSELDELMVARLEDELGHDNFGVAMAVITGLTILLLWVLV